MIVDNDNDNDDDDDNDNDDEIISIFSPAWRARSEDVSKSRYRQCRSEAGGQVLVRQVTLLFFWEIKKYFH